MRNFVKIVLKALAGEKASAGALSCSETGIIYSYGEVIAERTGPKSWLVQAAGQRSVRCRARIGETRIRSNKKLTVLTHQVNI